MKKTMLLLCCFIAAVTVQSQTITPVAPPNTQPVSQKATITEAEFTGIVGLIAAKVPLMAGKDLTQVSVASASIFGNRVMISLTVNGDSVTHQLNQADGSSLVASLLDPPAGHGYDSIALPIGKTQANVQSISVLKQQATFSLSLSVK